MLTWFGSILFAILILGFKANKYHDEIKNIKISAEKNLDRLNFFFKDEERAAIPNVTFSNAKRFSLPPDFARFVHFEASRA